MPNWVTNRIKVKKSFEEIKEYVKGEETEFDFNKIIAQPKTMCLTCGGKQNESIQFALLNKTEEEREKIEKVLKDTKENIYGNYYKKFFHRKYDLNDLTIIASQYKISEREKELNIKTFEDLGNTYINNILQYGYDTWYDWNCENWGTKWNACDVYINKNIFEFDTAWSCPFAVLKKLSKIFNDVEFLIQYADEDIGNNCGEFKLLNGEIISFIDKKGNYDFALELKGYDEEEKKEYLEKYIYNE